MRLGTGVGIWRLLGYWAISDQEAAEKYRVLAEMGENHTSGAKAHRFFSATCGTTEVVP
jgi:hypothetical protein